ncbi:hypothetical protein GCM10027190_11130 [Spirosoma areae]
MISECSRTKLFLQFCPAIQGVKTLALCRNLYERKLLVQDDIERGITKKISEDNVHFLQALKACLSLSTYVKKRQNTFSLTKSGQQAVGKERRFLVEELLRVVLPLRYETANAPFMSICARVTLRLRSRPASVLLSME